jgi:hypothetical protein
MIIRQWFFYLIKHFLSAQFCNRLGGGHVFSWHITVKAMSASGTSGRYPALRPL